jgi:hypothetical protein
MPNHSIGTPAPFIGALAKVLVAGLLAVMPGCAAVPEPQAGRVTMEDGFVDVDLPISDYHVAGDGTSSVIAKGRIDGQTVSFAVDFGGDWKMQRMEDADLAFYRGNGRIRSLGQESDAFLALLVRKYGISRPPPKMAPGTAMTMFGLNNDPRALHTTPARIKIFFEDNGEDNYAEAFLNIDLSNRVLEFHDKDPDYHQGIVASLAGEH